MHLFSPDNREEHLLVSSAEFFYSIIMHEKQEDSSEKRPKHDHGKIIKNYKYLLIGWLTSKKK